MGPDPSSWTQLCCKLRKLLEPGAIILAELTFADHVRNLDPLERGRGGMERPKALDWARQPLDRTVVLLDHIVQILRLNDLDESSVTGEVDKTD